MRNVVLEKLSELTDIPVQQLRDDMSLRDDLDIDSLAAVELAVELESELGATIDNEKLIALETVGDVLGLVDGLKK